MDKFTASNGVHIRVEEPVADRGEPLVVDGSRIPPIDTQALREFFVHERDVELGRWRWPENPDLLVYRVITKTGEDTGSVRVVSEASGFAAEPFPRGAATSGACSDAARAYFDAHPEPKPWHDAKPGEVWEVNVDDPLIGERAMTVFLGDSGPVASLFFGFWNGPDADAIDIESTEITTARRIYPEVSNG